MRALENSREQVRFEVELLDIFVEYVAGKTSSVRDQYKATFSPLGITCYGPTIEQVVKSAKDEAYSLAIKFGSLKKAIEEQRPRLAEAPQ